MNGYGRIAQHRLGPRRGDRDKGRLSCLWVDKWISQVPETTLDRFGENFVVADCRLQIRIPIHQPLSSID